MSGFRITGLLLAAVAWLQVSLCGHASENSSLRAGSDRSSVPTAYTTQAPGTAVQFHQLRLPGIWFGKGFDLEISGTEGLPAQTIRGLNDIWRVASAPDELLKTWQFTRRTALQPRAPCGI